MTYNMIELDYIFSGTFIVRLCCPETVGILLSIYHLDSTKTLLSVSFFLIDTEQSLFDKMSGEEVKIKSSWLLFMAIVTCFHVLVPSLAYTQLASTSILYKLWYWSPFIVCDFVWGWACLGQCSGLIPGCTQESLMMHRGDQTWRKWTNWWERGGGKCSTCCTIISLT